MKQTEPKITVLMPAYNAEKYIGKAICSVLAQSFVDFELLIINDGSTDNTEKIIRYFDDDRIRLINQSNQGIAAALNMGLMNANASLIARFDADDICMPQRLELQYHFLMSNTDYVLLGSNAEYIDMNDEYVFTGRMLAQSDEDIRQLIFNYCPLIHSSIMFRKEVVIQAGCYNTDAHAFEDHFLWSNLIRLGKAGNLQETLVKVRLAPESISIDEKWRTKRFREIKSTSLTKGSISEEEGRELLNILKNQNNSKIKEGSYYSLLAKKYLWDNHQPKKARINLMKAIHIHPGRLDSYAIMALSFFPKAFIDWLYRKRLQKI
jgi:glycosyltransferase involved in cell wall biosynthesis